MIDRPRGHIPAVVVHDGDLGLNCTCGFESIYHYRLVVSLAELESDWLEHLAQAIPKRRLRLASNSAPKQPTGGST